jgi:hypothetical protein
MSTSILPVLREKKLYARHEKSTCENKETKRS